MEGGEVVCSSQSYVSGNYDEGCGGGHTSWLLLLVSVG